MKHNPKRYAPDWDALVHRSNLDRTPRMDPLLAVEWYADRLSDPRFRPGRYCSTCHRDDKLPQTDTAFRPPGTVSREGCHGCLIGMLEGVGEELDDVRDRLFSEWAQAKEEVALLELSKKNAQSPEDKAAWRKRKKRAINALSEAADACKLAGFSPHRKARRRVLRHGDVPRAELMSPVESQEFE